MKTAPYCAGPQFFRVRFLFHEPGAAELSEYVADVAAVSRHIAESKGLGAFRRAHPLAAISFWGLV